MVLCVLAAMLPWLQTTQFNNVQAAPKQFLLLLAAGSIFVALAFARVFVVPQSRTLTVSVGVLLGAVLLSTLLSEDTRLSLFGWYYHRFGMVTYLSLLVMFFAGMSMRAGKLQYPVAVAGAIGAVGSVGVALAQEHGWGELARLTAFGGRPNGGLGNANDLAAFLVLAVAFSPALSRRGPARLRLALPALYLAILVFGVFMSASRLGVLVMPVAVVSTWVLIRLQPGQRQHATRLAIPLVAGIVLGTVLATLDGSVGAVIGRFEARTPVPGKDQRAPELVASSGRIRLELWAVAGRAILDAPLVGHGPDTLALVSGRNRRDSEAQLEGRAQLIAATPHNALLEVLIGSGLVAGLAFGLLISGALVAGLRRVREADAWAPWAVAGAAGYAGMSMLNPESIAGSALFWLLLGSLLQPRRLRIAPQHRVLVAPILLPLGAALALAGISLFRAETRAADAARAAARGDHVAAAALWATAARAMPTERRYTWGEVSERVARAVQTRRKGDTEASEKAALSHISRFQPLAQEALLYGAVIDTLRPGDPLAHKMFDEVIRIEPHSRYWRSQVDAVVTK
jgi:O-antigen ligase